MHDLTLLSYELRVRSVQFEDIYYPPQLMATVDIQNPIDKFPAVLQYTVHYTAYSGYYSTYQKEVHLAEGGNTFKEHLVLDPEIMRVIDSHLDRDKRETLSIIVSVALFHALSDNSLISSSNTCNVVALDFKKALKQEKKALDAYGIRPIPSFNTHLARNLSNIQNTLGSDSIESKVLSGMVKYVKELVMQESEVKAAESMRSLEFYAKEADLGHSWIVGAILLALHEIMVKQAVAKEGVKIKDAKFNDLVDQLQTILEREGITFEEMQLANLKGKRDYRHRVIHDGLEPNESAMRDIVTETIDLLMVMKKLKEKKQKKT